MDNELIDLLRTVSSGFQARMQAQVAADGTGLTTFQARLVNLIGRNDGISQLTLGAFTDRDKAQIARAVKELEARGFLARSPHPTDWRTKCLALTDDGKRMHARLHGMRKQLATAILGSLSDEEKRALRLTLKKIAAELQD